jgi:hypothetical protein
MKVFGIKKMDIYEQIGDCTQFSGILLDSEETHYHTVYMDDCVFSRGMIDISEEISKLELSQLEKIGLLNHKCEFVRKAVQKKIAKEHEPVTIQVR